MPINPVKTLLILCLLLPVSVWALSSDRDKPIQIEADRLEVDDSKRTSEYSGNVKMTQGSLSFAADRMIFHFDKNQDLDHIRILGQPARFKQLNDDNKPIKASARELDYYESDGRLEMRGQARLESDADVIESEHITLNINNDTVEAGDPQGNNRVRMVIQPKNSSNE